MLFSDKEIAQFINDNFEPVWQSVRAVPTVRIDFGNGKVITRTLHGNIATYVCSPSGRVLDILPGIYAPRAYRTALDKTLRLADRVKRCDPAEQQTLLASYHKHQAKLLGKKISPRSSDEIPKLASSEDVANWQELNRDTRLNENVRRHQIHEMLATTGAVRPEFLTKWLYREVLHSDLDDPYLGLRKVLSSDSAIKAKERVN